MRLTVIIPTFNRAKLLTEAIQSIVDHRPVIYEVVVCDDGSTDETQMLCHEWQQSNYETRFLVSRSVKNSGAQVARNLGLKKATGDFIMFMDSDDVLSDNGVLPLLQEFQENPNLDYVYGNVIRTNATLQPIEPIVSTGSRFSSDSVNLAGYHWHTMGAIYRREYILKKVGFWNEDLTSFQDWEFQARVKIAEGKRKFVDHTVGYLREHSGDRVSMKKKFRPDYFESAIKACLLIHEKAQISGKLDLALERRLMKKLILYALVLSANGHPNLRMVYIKQAIENLCFKDQFAAAMQIFSLLPPQLDSLLLEFIYFLLPQQFSLWRKNLQK